MPKICALIWRNLPCHQIFLATRLDFHTLIFHKYYWAIRSSCSQMFFKIGVLKNFANFTGKHRCWSLIQTCNFLLKRDSNTGVFLWKICEIFKNIYFYRTPLVTAPELWLICNYSLDYLMLKQTSTRSSLPEVFLRKGILNIYSKFTGEHPWRSAISIKLLCNFIEITLRHGCSPVIMLHIFRTPFLENTFGWLLLFYQQNQRLVAYFKPAKV